MKITDFLHKTIEQITTLQMRQGNITSEYPWFFICNRACQVVFEYFYSSSCTPSFSKENPTLMAFYMHKAQHHDTAPTVWQRYHTGNPMTS